MRNGVVALTRDGIVRVMNDVACRVLGVSVRVPVGRHYATLLASCPEVQRLLARALDHGATADRAELRLRHTERVIGYTLAQVADERGKPQGVTLLFRDLTRVEQLEERERLKDRLVALGEMAATIAHEIKNPLAGIEVTAGLLKRRVKDVPDAVVQLNAIIHEAKMANRIVMEVLDFVRPLRLQVERVDVHAMLADAVESAARAIPGADARIDLHIDGTLPSLEGDGPQLRQLVTNLVVNALEALAESRPSGGAVRVNARAVAPAAPEGMPLVEIVVADNGPGVADDVRDRIFSPFFTTKSQGTGLGLANVRKTVDAHDGRIELLPSREGATFRLTLPVVAVPDTLAHPDDWDPTDARGRERGATAARRTRRTQDYEAHHGTHSGS